MKIYRHGDVLLRTATIPAEATAQPPRRDGNHILAEGEATGHHHAIAATPAVEYLLHPDGGAYLRVHEGVELTHQEHATITIAPGDYEVVQQREYDEMEGVRRVID